MKIQMTAKITDDNGREITRTIEKEAVIPDISEYGEKESFSEIFHRYEKTTIQIRNELAEEITGEYLNGAAALKKTEKSRNCELEAEIGRCRVENGSEIMGVDKPKERARSRAFTELCLTFAGSMSVRDGVKALKRVLWRSGPKELKLRTYADFCQCQGRQIKEAKAREENGFNGESGMSRQETTDSPLRKEGGARNDASALREAKETLETSFGLSGERMEALASELENPAESCYVSPDDVLIRRQKERRTEEYQKRKPL